MKKLLIFFSLGVIALAFTIFWINPSELSLHFYNIEYFPLGLSVLFYLSSFFIRALRWKVLIKPLADKVSFRNLFWMVCISLMVNVLLPLKIGEVVRAYLLKIREKVLFVEGLSSVIVERLLDILTLALIGIIGLNVIPEALALPSWIHQGIRVTGLTVGGLMGFFILGLVKKDPLIVKLVSLLRFLKVPYRLVDRGTDILNSMFKGASGLSISKVSQFQVSIMTLLIWLVHIGWIYFTFQAFNINIALPALILGFVIVTLGTLIPSPPGFLGTFEALWLTVFLALGSINIGRLLALILIAHLVNVGSIMVVGTLGLFFMGLSFGEVLKGSKG
ncbi:MAG: lysylphosphatidylglycerol synthase transmembrane domain-containing protein [Nitrososphaerales archaeon]